MEVRQVLALAVEKEESAARLYERMAQDAPEPAVKALLEDVAAQERQHRQLLLRIDPADLPAFEPGEALTPALADFLEARPIPADSRAQEVLACAIRREREACAFYARMSERLQDGELRALLGKLAAMEAGHQARLKELYRSTFVDEN